MVAAKMHYEFAHDIAKYVLELVSKADNHWDVIYVDNMVLSQEEPKKKKRKV